MNYTRLLEYQIWDRVKPSNLENWDSRDFFGGCKILERKPSR
jgi:hypothetical protein